MIGDENDRYLGGLAAARRWFVRAEVTFAQLTEAGVVDLDEWVTGPPLSVCTMSPHFNNPALSFVTPVAGGRNVEGNP